MSDKDLLKFELNNKLKILKDIRHEIKKKRFILDENREKFGFDDMTQLTKVKNTSEVKGYPFVASKIESKILKGVKIGLKVVPIETKFDKHEHPTNLEFLALKELTDNIVCKNISPHIVYYLAHNKISNKSRALKFLNLKRLEVEEHIRTHSNMLVSEYIEGGSLDGWVYDIYETDEEIKDEDWRAVVFQLIYTISIIQHYYKMMHNDFHYGNILIDTSIKKNPGQYFVYTINNKTYYLPNTGAIPKLWDFEFAMAYSDKIPDFYPNKFIIGNCEYDRKKHITKEPILEEDDSLDSDDLNVPYNYNEVYDLHYFLTSLLDLYISQELFDWILEIYPNELIPREDSDRSSDSSSDSSSERSTDSSSKADSKANSKAYSKAEHDKQYIKHEVEDELKDKLDKISIESKSNDTNESESDNSESDNSESDNSESDNTENDNTESDNSESDDSESGNSSSSNNYNRYLSEGRMKNGVENEFKDLPKPLAILEHKFFDSFKNKPNDFDESKAIYFKAGF